MSRYNDMCNFIDKIIPDKVGLIQCASMQKKIQAWKNLPLG